MSEWWHGKPPPPVTPAEWNETEYKILVQQVAILSATEAQLQAECWAKRSEASMKAITKGDPTLAIATPCASVSNDLKNAKYLLWRQEKARDLLEQKTGHSGHTKTGNQALSE
ncbi:MAG: hypothetical protein OXI88_18800 [Gammaproteobacteria bacterium]|nr:hypothetical protein [Gammaproteobacteria bacterium]